MLLLPKKYPKNNNVNNIINNNIQSSCPEGIKQIKKTNNQMK